MGRNLRAGPANAASGHTCASALVAFIVCLPAASFAAGACYKAESLKGPYGEPGSKPIEPVCLALEKNLNEFCDEPPMVCKLRIHPIHAHELSLPRWEPVELGGNLSLIEELIRTPYASAPDPNAAQQVWQGLRPDIEAAFQDGRLTVSTAMLDLYQTGTKAKVYRYDLGDCAQKNPYLGASNKNGSWAVKIKTPEISVNLAPIGYKDLEKRYYPLAGSWFGGDVFLFRGKAFSYYMLGFHRQGENPDLPPTNELRVNQGINYILNGKPTIFFRNVCELNYQPARRPK